MKIKGRNISWWLSALLSGMVIVLMPTLSRAAGDVDEARLKAADSEPQIGLHWDATPTRPISRRSRR
jgi:hypothetical protein